MKLPPPHPLAHLFESLRENLKISSPLVLSIEEVKRLKHDADNEWFVTTYADLKSDGVQHFLSQVIVGVTLGEWIEHLPSLPVDLQLYLSPTTVNFIEDCMNKGAFQTAAELFYYVVNAAEFGLGRNILSSNVVPPIIQVAKVFVEQCENVSLIAPSFWGRIILLSAESRRGA